MPEEIKRHANQLAAVACAELIEHRNVSPELVHRGNLVEMVVVNLQKRALFKIWKHHPPATPQVVNRAKCEITFQRFFVNAFAKFREVRTTRGIIVKLESAGDAHRPAQGGEAEFFSFRSLDGLANCRAQPDDIHEVVEVSGLQRGVLPVVRETEKFLVALGDNRALPSA
jgi:hypothetical protein